MGTGVVPYFFSTPASLTAFPTTGSCAVAFKEKNYASATIGRMFRRGSQFFKAAIEGEILTRNPLSGVKTPSQKNKERQRFITQDVARKVIEAGTDASWRLVIALSRFGGLRIPSELVALTWTDIRWDENKFRV